MAEKMEKPDFQAQEEAMTPDNAATQEQNPRELLYERIRTSRPGANYEDEFEYYRQAMSIMDELGKKSGDYDNMSQRMMSRFNQNPEEAEAFLAYLDGAPLVSAIRRHMGDEALSVKEGDDGWDSYVQAGKEREEQHVRNREALDTFMSNAQESDKVKADFIAESGMDEEGAAAFNDLMMSVLNDLAIGKVSKETLQLFKRASDYEKDVEGAREQGRVDGRNEKIEVEKKRMKGSGLPNAQASGNASEEVDAKPSNETASWLGKFPRR